nr:hypothetical protein [Mesorhizobium onobrychidis]
MILQTVDQVMSGLAVSEAKVDERYIRAAFGDQALGVGCGCNGPG